MLRPCETWKKQNKWHRVNSKFSFFSFSGKNCLPNAYKRGYKYKAQLLLYLNFKDCLIFQTIFRLFFSVACWCPFYWKPARSSTCEGLSGCHVTQSDIKCLRRKSSGAALVHNAKHLVSCYLSKVTCVFVTFGGSYSSRYAFSFTNTTLPLLPVFESTVSPTSLFVLFSHTFLRVLNPIS